MVDSITDERFRGAIGDMRVFQSAGLETFRRFIRNELPGPPISRLIGLRPTEASLGKATFTMPITSWLEDGFGLYWGGVFGLLADAPLTAAIWTTLPPGKTATTTELNMSFVRPITRETERIVGKAETVHSGNQVGLSTVQITDQYGRMLGFGSTRCLIVDVPVDVSAEYAAPDTGPDNPQDPYLRPAPKGDYFSLDEVMNGTPIELQRESIERELVFPVWRLTGYRPTFVQDGYVESRLPSAKWFSNGSPSIYGGLLAWAAEFTMGAAVWSTLPAGDVFATLDMHVRFTRPAAIDTGDLMLTASVRHKGRRLRVTSCEVQNAKGKVVAMATSSVLVVKEGVRELAQGRLPDEIVLGWHADWKSGVKPYRSGRGP